MLKKRKTSKKPTSAVSDSVLSEAGATYGEVAKKKEETGVRLAYSDESSLIYHGDSFKLLEQIIEQYPEGRFDAIFADPPYFLSNDGFTCKAGKMVSVNKGEWDKSGGIEKNHEFNLRWLSLCQRALKKDGTIWVSGTQHVIFSVGHAMQQLGFKILNMISWEKPNPPPNLSCRYFTHSTEILLWAAKNEKSRHYFDYDRMREINGGRQMKCVWKIAAPGTDEKRFGKHPTQKPVALVERCLRASVPRGGWVMDPFLGSGTTAVVAKLLGLNFVGSDQDPEYVELAKRRVRDAEDEKASYLFKNLNEDGSSYGDAPSKSTKSKKAKKTEKAKETKKSKEPEKPKKSRHGTRRSN